MPHHPNSATNKSPIKILEHLSNPLRFGKKNGTINGPSTNKAAAINKARTNPSIINFLYSLYLLNTVSNIIYTYIPAQSNMLSQYLLHYIYCELYLMY